MERISTMNRHHPRVLGLLLMRGFSLWATLYLHVYRIPQLITINTHRDTIHTHIDDTSMVPKIEFPAMPVQPILAQTLLWKATMTSNLFPSLVDGGGFAASTI